MISCFVHGNRENMDLKKTIRFPNCTLRLIRGSPQYSHLISGIPGANPSVSSSPITSAFTPKLALSISSPGRFRHQNLLHRHTQSHLNQSINRLVWIMYAPCEIVGARHQHVSNRVPRQAPDGRLMSGLHPSNLLVVPAETSFTFSMFLSVLEQLKLTPHSRRE